MATPTAEAAVRSLLARVAEQVEALPSATLRKLYPILSAAEAELAGDLSAWLRTIDDGAQRFTAYHYRSILRQLRHSMDVIKSLEPTLAEALAAGSVEAAGLSNVLLQQEIARLSAAFEGAIPGLDIPTVAHLVERNNWLMTRYARQARRYTQRAQVAIRAQLGIGVARGESIHELAKRLMRLQPGARGVWDLAAGSDVVAGGMARGLFAGRFYEAERLVRTEVMNAYNTHHATTIADAGLQKRWDASSDRHCLLCHALDGETVAADEEFSSGDMYPPRHPNCRCVLIPWSADWAEIKPLPPLDTPEARRYSHPGGAVVTRGGTAKETNRALKNRTSTAAKRRAAQQKGTP